MYMTKYVMMYIKEKSYAGCSMIGKSTGSINIKHVNISN